MNHDEHCTIIAAIEKLKDYRCLQLSLNAETDRYLETLTEIIDELEKMVVENEQ